MERIKALWNDPYEEKPRDKYQTKGKDYVMLKNQIASRSFVIQGRCD